MKILIKNIVKNPLFSGSLIMIIGSNAVNILNYLYHLMMGRMLGPAKYGELAALFSLIGLLGLIAVSFGLVIVKYISANDEKEIGGLKSQLNRKLILFACIISVIIVLSSSVIASFLNIQDPLLIVSVGIIFIFIMAITLNRAILQGTLQFSLLVTNVFAENGIKLALGVLLVYMGFSTGGAIAGLIVAVVITWLLSEQFVKKYSQKIKNSEIKLKPLILYSIPVILQSIAITSLYSADLVLTKHFFSAKEAGIYASLSTLGKIIFFAAGPVASVMFPIVSKKQSKGENYYKVFIYSLALISIISLSIIFIYLILPNLAIKILFGPLYLEGASFLAWFSFSIALMTISYFLINFHLSLNRVKIVIFPILTALAQIVGIWFYHQNLMEVIFVSIIVNLLLLLFMSVYTFLSFRTIKK